MKHNTRLHIATKKRVVNYNSRAYHEGMKYMVHAYPEKSLLKEKKQARHQSELVQGHGLYI